VPDLLSSLLAVRGFGVLSIDADGRVLCCNDAGAEVLGVSASELIGRRPSDFATLCAEGVQLPAERHPIAIALRTRASHDAGIVEIRRRDGSIRWARLETVPLLEPLGADRVLLTVTDVTASHDVELALRAERRRLARAGDRFRRVLESVPDAIAVYHEQGFGYANASLVALLGYESIADLVGREVAKVLPGHTPLSRGGSETRPALREESWRRVDGTVVVVEIAAHGIDLDGEEGTLLIARDITERKRAQMELVQSTRLASVGTLAAGVAHEINNPLAYVIANLELMTDELRGLDGAVPPARLEELIAMAEDASSGADSVRKIVRGLKLFSRVDEERRVILDVSGVMDVSINMATNEIRHRARLVKEYGHVPRIEADEGRLGQVFLNLLVNAAQAIPEGNVAANEIQVTTRTDGAGRAVIEIRDTGAGIPPEELGRIFDPFFTTKPIGVGTGLGLSICHGLIGEIGGELHVESTVGTGTMFRITLPAATAEIAPPIEARSVVEVQTCRRARVLVVDDDTTVAEAVRRVLAPEHDVTVVNSGMKALARVVAGETFDLILCDLMMPQMTGMSFFGELTAIAPAQCERVVFITGGAFSPGAGAFLDHVPNQRVDKPFDFRALRALVRGFAPASD